MTNDETKDAIVEAIRAAYAAIVEDENWSAIWRLGAQMAGENAIAAVRAIQLPAHAEINDAIMGGCGCAHCLDAGWDRTSPRPSRQRMVVCDRCGNKRCPHATHHIYACTGSNATGQPGSSFGPLPTPAAPPAIGVHRSIYDSPEMRDILEPQGPEPPSAPPADSVTVDDTQWTECPRCHGGHCPECDGRGKLSRDDYDPKLDEPLGAHCGCLFDYDTNKQLQECEFHRKQRAEPPAEKIAHNNVYWYAHQEKSRPGPNNWYVSAHENGDLCGFDVTGWGAVLTDEKTARLLASGPSLTAENQQLRKALAGLIPWAGELPDGPDWATPEAKSSNRAMFEEALENACNCFPPDYNGFQEMQLPPTAAPTPSTNQENFHD